MIEHAPQSTFTRALVRLRPRKRIKWTLHLARRFVGYRLFLRLGSSYRNLKRLGVIEMFVGYPKEAIPPQYDDLWGLYLIVMERKPRVILELGGGYSTFVLAHAVRELARQGIGISFISVDESDFWQQVVKDHLPHDLLPFVRFHRSDPVVNLIGDERVSMFANLPVDSCNFLYVDGGLLPGAKIGADALLLEHKAPPDYAIQIDHRTKTVAFLKNNLKHQYDIGPGRNGVQTLFVRRA